jgi:hypothetical protein
MPVEQTATPATHHDPEPIALREGRELPRLWIQTRSSTCCSTGAGGCATSGTAGISLSVT